MRLPGGKSHGPAAAYDLPTAISGSVLAFLKDYNGGPENSEVGYRLFLLRIPSKLRGIPGDSWELKGPGIMYDLCIDAAQDLLLFRRYVTSLSQNDLWRRRIQHRDGNLHVRALSSGN